MKLPTLNKLSKLPDLKPKIINFLAKAIACSRTVLWQLLVLVIALSIFSIDLARASANCNGRNVTGGKSFAFASNSRQHLWLQERPGSSLALGGNRLVEEQRQESLPSAPRLVKRFYDPNSNLTSVEERLVDDSIKAEVNRFDRRDRLIEAVDRNGKTQKFGYDAQSNEISYTDSTNVTTTREFDKKNRLIKVIRATLGSIALSYSAADELKTIDYPTENISTQTVRSYDDAGRLAKIEVMQGIMVTAARAYTFDKNGNRNTQVEYNGGVGSQNSSYEYDEDDRLIKVLGPDQVEEYALNEVGNRTSEIVKNLSNVTVANKSFVYNAREQLVSLTDSVTPTNNSTFTYDANGNQTKVGNKLYEWSSQNRLMKGDGVDFKYDSMGHRTAKKINDVGTNCIWNGNDLVEETLASGFPKAQVTRVGTLLLGEVRDGNAQYLMQDAFNSVILAVKPDATTPGRASYRAFGQVRQLTGTIASPFRFNGYVDDGGDLLSSPSRFYSLGTGSSASELLLLPRLVFCGCGVVWLQQLCFCA